MENEPVTLSHLNFRLPTPRTSSLHTARLNLSSLWSKFPPLSQSVTIFTGYQVRAVLKVSLKIPWLYFLITLPTPLRSHDFGIGQDPHAASINDGPPWRPALVAKRRSSGGAWATLYSRPSRSSFTAASARLDVAAELLVLNVERTIGSTPLQSFSEPALIYLSIYSDTRSLPDRIFFLGAGPSLSPCLSDHSYKDTVKS